MVDLTGPPAKSSMFWLFHICQAQQTQPWILTHAQTWQHLHAIACPYCVDIPCTISRDLECVQHCLISEHRSWNLNEHHGYLKTYRRMHGYMSFMPYFTTSCAYVKIPNKTLRLSGYTRGRSYSPLLLHDWVCALTPPARPSNHALNACTDLGNTSIHIPYNTIPILCWKPMQHLGRSGRGAAMLDLSLKSTSIFRVHVAFQPSWIPIRKIKWP